MTVVSPVRPAGGPTDPGRVVVGGAGMVAHRLVEQMLARGEHAAWELTVLGDEPYRPYDRVHLSEFFDGRDADALALAPTVWDDARVTVRT